MNFYCHNLQLVSGPCFPKKGRFYFLLSENIGFVIHFWCENMFIVVIVVIILIGFLKLDTEEASL